MAAVSFDLGIEFSDRVFGSLENLKNPVIVDNQETGDVTLIVGYDRFAFDIVEVLSREGFGGLAEIAKPENRVIFLLLNRFPQEVCSR